MDDSYIAKHINPRGQTMKSAEMTVKRALAMIRVFDEVEKGGDWTDADHKQMKAALGDDGFDPRQAILPELWRRYRDKTLFQEVRDLAANIDMEAISKKARKEIENGLNKISDR